MIDLVNILKAICQHNRDALEYVPEGWVVAELYAELKKQASSAGWMPFDMEMPYVTILHTSWSNFRSGTIIEGWSSV